MLLTESKVQEIARRSKTYDAFTQNLHAATEPHKPIKESTKGEYVRIRSKTYGRRTTTDYNLGIPLEGRIIKINPKSVVVRVVGWEGKKENTKYPVSAMVSDDISVLLKMMKGNNKEVFWESYWRGVSKRLEKIGGKNESNN